MTFPDRSLFSLPDETPPAPKYRYRIDGPIVAIEDLNGPVPVALAAEQVLDEIQREIGSIDGMYVVWRDTLGIWDGMEYERGLLVFYPIDADTYEEAKRLILSGELPGENWIMKNAEGLRQPYDPSTWDDVHPA
jgi:hypothetical protein